MTLTELLFGRRPDESGLKVIKSAPRGAVLKAVTTRPGGPEIRAEKAIRDGLVETGGGKLSYRAGKDYVVEHESGGRAVVRADIFEKLYRPLGAGRYAKRDDVVLHYFTLPRPVLVRTLEGLQRANAGDWIMKGVAGELWPVPASDAGEKYIEIGTAH